MNKKRIIALLVSLVLVVSAAVTVSAAAFPDIESRHSWAEDAINDMVGRGILKGYTDGTFKPDRPVTRLETLIIASRVMGVDEEENKEYREAAVEKYADALAPYDIDFKDEMAYLLYWNVLSTSELSSYISDTAKNQALKRYEAAVLLTKLIGGEDEALAESVIVIDFADASSIPSSAKAYVKYISDIGIMNGVENNNFNPNGELTRAMISTIMYRSENHMDESVVMATVEKVGASSLTVSINGKSKEIPVPENVVIKVDAKDKELSDVSVNQVIRIHYQGDEIRFIDAVSSNLYFSVSGTISSMSEISGTKKISVKNSAGVHTYPVNSSSCEYIIDNVISRYIDISNGQYATLTVQAGSITKVVVETGSKTVKGKLVEVTIDEEVVAVTVENEDGDERDYIINDNASIIRNGSKTEIRSLAEGDSLTLTIKNGGVAKLVATSSSKSVKGTISKIVIAPQSEITIKTGTDENVYGVTSDTVFIVDGKNECTIYDLRLGATADVRLDSTNIHTISTQSLVVSPTMTGVITYIHPTSYVMGIDVIDPATGDVQSVQTVVKSSVKVTDTTSSRISTFKALQPGMTVVVVGTSSYGVYEVNQIIVTADVQ